MATVLMAIEPTVIIMMSNNLSPVPVLPDWTRWSWVGRTEREWWRPLIDAASNAYKEVERLAVVDGVRPAAYQNIQSSGLMEATEWALQHNIVCVPISIVGASTQYSSISTPVSANGNFNYRVIYTRPSNYANLRSNLNANPEALGTLLGYPPCCRQAFLKTWALGQVDSTWEQSDEGRTPNGPAFAHTLFRWMGIRLVSHMPCRHTCEASQHIGESLLNVGRQHGYHEEMQTIREVLNWPVQWSRLFGIAEITSPGLKISTRSDWTPTKQVFSRSGTYVEPQKTWWTDNGFSHAELMRSSHAPIIDALASTLPPKARLVDLGCGNGLLLRRLTIQRPDIKIAGVERETAALTRFPLQLGVKFWGETIEQGSWRDWNPTAVLYNPIRLTEMPRDTAALVARWISEVPYQFPYMYEETGRNRQQQATVWAAIMSHQLTAPQPLIKTPRVIMNVVMPFI